MTCKYPDTVVDLGDLSGPDGNIFCIIGRVSAALALRGVSNQEIYDFYDSVTGTRSYEAALEVCRSWVNLAQSVPNSTKGLDHGS